MPTNEKEYNGNLLDQLTLLERIEPHAIRLNDPALLELIEFEKKAINRKLYQQPPVSE